MKSRYIFQFYINGRPVFEKGGEYFYSDLVGCSDLAYGLFTDDPDGFEPVGDTAEYEKILAAADINSRLNSIAIVGVDKGDITTAVECRGDYEYFRFSGFKPGNVTDELAGFLVSKITRKTASSFSHPYIVKIPEKGGEKKEAPQ
jgi:hypothetical protein